MNLLVLVSKEDLVSTSLLQQHLVLTSQPLQYLVLTSLSKIQRMKSPPISVNIQVFEIYCSRMFSLVKKLFFIRDMIVLDSKNIFSYLVFGCLTLFMTYYGIVGDFDFKVWKSGPYNKAVKSMDW